MLEIRRTCEVSAFHAYHLLSIQHAVQNDLKLNFRYSDNEHSPMDMFILCDLRE